MQGEGEKYGKVENHSVPCSSSSMQLHFWQETNTAYSKVIVISGHYSHCSQLLFCLCVKESDVSLVKQDTEEK